MIMWACADICSQVCLESSDCCRSAVVPPTHTTWLYCTATSVTGLARDLAWERALAGGLWVAFVPRSTTRPRDRAAQPAATNTTLDF